MCEFDNLGVVFVGLRKLTRTYNDAQKLPNTDPKNGCKNTMQTPRWVPQYQRRQPPVVLLKFDLSFFSKNP